MTETRYSAYRYNSEERRFQGSTVTRDRIHRSLCRNVVRVGYSSVALGDYDNDGRADILLTGYDGSTNVSKIYHNIGSGFTEAMKESLRVSSGSVAWEIT